MPAHVARAARAVEDRPAFQSVEAAYGKTPPAPTRRGLGELFCIAMADRPGGSETALERPPPLEAADEGLVGYEVHPNAFDGLKAFFD